MLYGSLWLWHGYDSLASWDVNPSAVGKRTWRRNSSEFKHHVLTKVNPMLFQAFIDVKEIPSGNLTVCY